MAVGGPFATFLIIGPTCFFLGILFASFPYDYYVLWSTPPTTVPTFPDVAPNLLDPENMTALRAPYLAILEHHLKFLHASPPLISRVLHIVIGTGLAGLLAKLYKPTEANILFDGASLVLYMCGITVYITNLVKGMRVVTAGTYGEVGADLRSSRFADTNAEMRAAVEQGQLAPGEATIGREDSLKVIAASNTILALVLVGVLVLQAGQWYAQKKEQAEMEEMDRADGARRREKEKGGAGSGGAAVAVSTGTDAGGSSGSGSRKRQ